MTLSSKVEYFMAVHLPIVCIKSCNRLLPLIIVGIFTAHVNSLGIQKVFMNDLQLNNSFVRTIFTFIAGKFLDNRQSVD